jgi:hypothetical protein
MNNSNQSKLTLIPVMITFFTMGFVDLVGAVSNNMQEDFGLSDSAANFFPSLVFFWFLIFSVPTGMLMNKIGRKKTVLLSVVITTLAVFLPLFDSFMPTKESQLWLMYISFSLLGIGNAIMQTGIMDQMISASGKQDHALLLDCRSLETRLIPMPTDLAVLIVNSNVRRGLVDSEYNTRRQQCETAARHYGVKALRDLDLATLEAGKDGLDEACYRRARHVVGENARTLAAADALAQGDLVRLGELFHRFGMLGHAVGTQAKVLHEFGLFGRIFNLVIALLQVGLDLLRGHVLHAGHLVVAAAVVLAAHHAGAVHGATGRRGLGRLRGGDRLAGGIGAQRQAEDQGGGQQGLGQLFHG